MVAPRKEKAYEKYAWLIFLFLGLFGFIQAFLYLNLSDGLNPEGYLPGDYPLAFLVFAVLTTLLSVTGYRRGRKWAWFALLYAPPFLLIEAYFESLPPYFGGEFRGILALLSVVGLILPYRKFFPKKQPVTP